MNMALVLCDYGLGKEPVCALYGKSMLESSAVWKEEWHDIVDEEAKRSIRK